MSFLYEIMNEEFGKRGIEAVNLPKDIMQNLKFPLRDYQKEAFKRFICLNENEFFGKPKPPLHAMFNMATGSGKTLVMAGLMLYLFKKGYKNFIFFVNSDNIIKKTKENFLNANSAKYLFSERIFIDEREVLIKECENYEGAQNENEINIKFCTIQKFHADLNLPKENGLTYEELADKNIVLIADEAHHLNSSTRENLQILPEFQKPSWENTVEKVLSLNSKNILLEFSATIDFDSMEIARKYEDKVVCRYDLKDFRRQGFSKEIQILKSDMSDENKMMCAVILNLYRSILAAKHGINLKPVVLFKAQKTIAQSKENEAKFRNLIDNTDAKFIDKFSKEIKNETLKKAFEFFKAQGITSRDLANKIKKCFKERNCISVNDDAAAKENQILVNSLEDTKNPVRAIFAVNKLNEGWDVLNLFDIVRLYQTRDARDGRPGRTTISEAQLIGRGARYFPFKIDENDDKFVRKFDDDLQNELRILEEIYYHTNNDSRYISELKTALTDIGIYDENTMQKKLALKEDFKKTNFYKNAIVWHNDRIFKGYDRASLDDLKSEIDFKLSSNFATAQAVFEEEDKVGEIIKETTMRRFKLPPYILRSAMSADSYFHFENLRQNFPDLNASREFIELLNSKFTVNFVGDKEIQNEDLFKAARELLEYIKSSFEAKSKYKSGEFKSKKFKEIFKDKILNIARDDERAIGQESVVGNKNWYVFNANYGTSEEKAFVEFFSKQMDDIKDKFSEIYLVRNERELKIYDENGRAFEPDFLVFCKDIHGNKLNYQVFIEPKGDGFIANDLWKEKFLEKIYDEKLLKKEDKTEYLITAVPKFYNFKHESEFETKFKEIFPDS